MNHIVNQCMTPLWLQRKERKKRMKGRKKETPLCLHMMLLQVPPQCIQVIATSVASAGTGGQDHRMFFAAVSE
jgi:hypothetical protein